MDMSLQALPLVPWQLERGTRMGRMCSSSQLGLLSRKTQFSGCVRCRASEGEEDQAQERQAQVAAPLDSTKGAGLGSWVQSKAASADPYLGWTSDGSQQLNTNSAAGWIKIGGVTVLAIGFALGARCIYTKRDVANAFAISPSATEESTRSMSKASGAAVETLADVDGNKNTEAPNSISEGSLENAKGLNTLGTVSEVVQHQEESTPGQVCVPNEETEDHRENEFSISDSSAAAIMLTSEKGEQEEGTLEASVAEDQVLPSEDATEKGPDTTDIAMPVIKDTSTAIGKEEVSPNATKTADFCNEHIDVDVDLSTPSFASTEEVDAEDISEDPGMATTSSEELANQGEALSEGATSLREPTLDESSLHDDDIVEDLQGATPELEGLGNLAREGSLEKMTRQHNEWDERKPSIDIFPSSAGLYRRYLSATITAPATPPDSLPNLVGKVVVPAPVDHMQEQVLAALQALKVIEADVNPGDICTRREYARWLMAASAILTRSPAHKVLPSMYIENASVLAYEDVTPEDQDFPFIQGLAEAGLLSSRLLGDKQQEGDDKNGASIFSPDSHLTRQDLVTWKVALERKPAVLADTSSVGGVEAHQKIFGFIDVDKIHEDAWPALLLDINAGEQSIIALAFGHTRRLQPQKPVTKGQAAVALATGEAWEFVSEELARLEAESVAEAAVVAELALETKAQQEVASAFQELLQVEREKQHAAASLLEFTQAELEQVKADRESEKYSLLKERVVLDSQKEYLSSARLEVEEQALALSNAKLEVAFQREQADKLRAEAEDEKTLINKVRSELEIEKNALVLARSWAEDEARKAQAHSKALEQVRNRWESEGNVQELDTVDEKINSFNPSWQYSEGSQEENSPMSGLVKKSRDIGRMFVDAFLRFLQFIQLVFHAMRERVTDLSGKVGEKFCEARIKCVVSTTKTVEGLKQTVPSSVAGMAASLKEGTLKAVDEWKGGAERLSQKFKMLEINAIL